MVTKELEVFIQKHYIYFPYSGNIYKYRVGYVGSVRKDGYTNIRIKGKNFLRHRLCWFLYHGKWPKGQIDHINTDKKDDRISNLREATQKENTRNMSIHKDNSTGYKGVSICNRTGKFRARINVNRKEVHLGRFDTAEEAYASYKTAAKLYFKEFARYM